LHSGFNHFIELFNIIKKNALKKLIAGLPDLEASIVLKNCIGYFYEPINNKERQFH